LGLALGACETSDMSMILVRGRAAYWHSRTTPTQQGPSLFTSQLVHHTITAGLNLTCSYSIELSASQ